uniref:Putative LOC100573526 [Acyrthosiphon pisum] n=1 Tax=Lepeophtheirus salmonis TaxID=72036 RepID=A0A0K2TZD0_LEPSM
MPSYFSKLAKIVMSKGSLSSSRILKENINNKIHAFKMPDPISSISEQNLKLDRARLPDRIYESFKFSVLHGFFIGCCAKVNLDLSIRIW